MALKLKVLKVPSNRSNDDDDDVFDPGEGTSQGPAVSRPVAAPKAEARTRHHIFNQSAVQGW